MDQAHSKDQFDMRALWAALPRGARAILRDLYMREIHPKRYHGPHVLPNQELHLMTLLDRELLRFSPERAKLVLTDLGQDLCAYRLAFERPSRAKQP